MKKLMWVALALIGIAVLFIGISMLVYGDSQKPTSTTLLNSLSVQHPRNISVFAPRDSRVAQMASASDFRMTSLIPYLQNIDEAVSELKNDPSFNGYFETIIDKVNANNMHVVVLGPKTARNDDLDFFVLFASQKDTSFNVTSKFEIKCINKGESTSAELVRVNILNCEQALGTVTMMASSISIFDAKVWKDSMEAMRAENERRLEAIKQRALMNSTH